MNPARRTHLETKGWRVGGLEEFLSLPADDAAFIELKLLLSEQVRAYRRAKQMTPPKWPG
jgi:hypothetical protein